MKTYSTLQIDLALEYLTADIRKIGGLSELLLLLFKDNLQQLEKLQKQVECLTQQLKAYNNNTPNDN